MRVLSLNCRQWFRDTKRSQPTYWKKRAIAISDLIRRENPDVILFQEMIFPMTLFIPREYKRATWFSVSHHVYCKREFRVLRREWHMHWAKAIIMKPDYLYCTAFYSVHSHWDRKVYKKVSDQLVKDSTADGAPHRTIMGGDWNTEPESMLRLMRPLKLRCTGLLTFQNWTKPESRGELDYFAVNGVTTEGATRLTDFVSDHYAVVLEL